MAAILRAPALLLFSSPSPSIAPSTETLRTLPCFSSKARVPCPLRIKASPLSYKTLQQSKLRLFAAYGETTKAEETPETVTKEDSDEEILLDDDGATDDGTPDTAEEAASTVTVLLESYKEALVKNDVSKIAEIDAFLQSLENEKSSLALKVAALSEELLVERDRVLRISADFDNFRKRTERERLSLMTNAQGEVIESLLPVLDNFERAKAQIKVETEGEEKINNSYQSIYKQFFEILTSLGVESVETVGSTFNPLLHEAIMREESTEFEEGIILQEFRKGFKLGERLLRPSMVKVSAGPGPEKAKGDPIVDGNAEVLVEGNGEEEDSA